MGNNTYKMNILNIFNKRIRIDFVLLFFLITSFAFCYPLLANLYKSGRGDWDYYCFLQEIPAISFFEYAQMPLWNPYCGGGMPLVGNPQIAFPSLITIFTSLFGVLAGLKIAVWFHTFLGLLGMWILSGYMGAKGPARLAASLIFMFNGAWVMHLAEGHINWLSSALLPYMFLTYLMSFENQKWVIAAAFFESMMFYEGGAYVFAFCLLFMCMYGMLRSIEAKKWQPVKSLLTMNIIAALLSAPKLFPVLQLLTSNPRLKSAECSMCWEEILSSFINPDASFSNFGVWEYRSYLGVTVVVFYLASLRNISKHQSLTLTSIFMFLIGIGNFSNYSPWNILHKLPFWSYFQAPTRAFIVFNFTVAILISLYLSSDIKKQHNFMPLLVFAIITYMGVDLFYTNSLVFTKVSSPTRYPATGTKNTASIKNFAPVEYVEFKNYYDIDPLATTALWHHVPSMHNNFTQIRIPGTEKYSHGAWSDQYLPLLQNRGVVDAYETIPFERYAKAINDKDYRGEYYFMGEGIANQLRWSPNKLKYHIKLTKPDRLVINQNYWPGWKTSHGVVLRQNGLLAIDLPAGEYDLKVKYHPIAFKLGLMVFIATLISILVSCLSDKLAKLVNQFRPSWNNELTS